MRVHPEVQELLELINQMKAGLVSQLIVTEGEELSLVKKELDSSKVAYECEQYDRNFYRVRSI